MSENPKDKGVDDVKGFWLKNKFLRDVKMLKSWKKQKYFELSA